MPEVYPRCVNRRTYYTICHMHPVPAKAKSEEIIWSNLNTGEAFPDVVTPMTWSLVEELLLGFIGSLTSRFGIALPSHGFVGLVEGRIYFNFNLLYLVFLSLPIIRNMSVSEVFGGDEEGFAEAIQRLGANKAEVKIRYGNFFMQLPKLAFWFFRHQPHRARLAIAYLHSETDDFKTLDIASAKEDELIRCIRTMLSHYLDEEYASYALLGSMYSSGLYILTKKWLDDKEGTIANTLLSNLGTLNDAKAATELGRLASIATKHSFVRETILEGDPFSVLERLQTKEEGKEFCILFRQYLDKHGHHTRGELELYNARWAEQPEYVVNHLRGYVNNKVTLSFEETAIRKSKERKSLVVRCRAKLGFFKEALFYLTLKMAEAGTPIRENIKNEGVRQLALIRKIVLELGTRFAAKGLLLSRDDIFFLQLKEVESLALSEEDAGGLRASIVKRKEEYAQNSKGTPPSITLSGYHPPQEGIEQQRLQGTVLKGLGVSSGKVIGKAKVILQADKNKRVDSGEILVAPFTDPGWTPYFFSASGIVISSGGMLSHGSILAREFGIPAVVNVKRATEIIKNGQMIEVDSSAGTVTILS